jgi:hypothetical protein
MDASTEGGANAEVHLLVDFENLKPLPRDVALIRSEEYRLWVFHGPHQNRFDAALVKAWQPLGGRVDFVQSSKHGKNALDFHIAYKLGELFANERAVGLRASYIVVSGDGGFEPLFEYMRTQGCAVTLVGSIPEALAIKVPASVKATGGAAPSAAPFPRQRPSRGIIPATPKPVQGSPPKKKSVAKVAAGVRHSMVDSDVTTAIAELRAHPKNRPGDRAALERYIVARLGNKVTLAVAGAVIGELERQKVISFNGKSVVYKVPKAKQ